MDVCSKRLVAAGDKCCGTGAATAGAGTQRRRPAANHARRTALRTIVPARCRSASWRQSPVTRSPPPVASRHKRGRARPVSGADAAKSSRAAAPIGRFSPAVTVPGRLRRKPQPCRPGLFSWCSRVGAGATANRSRKNNFAGRDGARTRLRAGDGARRYGKAYRFSGIENTATVVFPFSSVPDIVSRCRLFRARFRSRCGNFPDSPPTGANRHGPTLNSATGRWIETGHDSFRCEPCEQRRVRNGDSGSVGENRQLRRACREDIQRKPCPVDGEVDFGIHSGSFSRREFAEL